MVLADSLLMNKDELLALLKDKDMALKYIQVRVVPVVGKLLPPSLTLMNLLAVHSLPTSTCS